MKKSMMERNNIEKQYEQVRNLVFNGKLKSALDLIEKLVRNSSKSDYFYQLEYLTENYQNLLKYAFEGYADPKREEILAGLSASILNLADETKQSLTEKDLVHQRFEKNMIKKEFGEDPGTISEKLDEMLFSKTMHRVAEETGTTTHEEQPINNIFMLLWLTDKLNDNYADQIRKMISSDNLEWHDKSLVVSGLTMSLLRFFDSGKLLLLIEFIETRQQQTYERALAGLVIALIFYNKRVMYYPEITKALNELSKDDTIRNGIESIILQLLMAQETEKITEEFEKDVLPEMKKMMPKIEDKLQLGKLFEDEDTEGKNPGWKDMIDEVPGLFERIEKFTRMQMEGGDVFMGTFKMLKGFDFFNKMSNWFIPYYAQNPHLSSLSGSDPEVISRLLEGLDHAFYICNSDKYSFVLNFMMLPEQQQTMIVTHFESELQQMKEMSDEEKILGQDSSSNTIFIQYIQDLYRFFKLYSFHSEFDDFFLKKIRFTNLCFYQTWFEQEKFTEKLAAFYFDNDHYAEAIEIYDHIISKSEPQAEYFEKIAYSYQKLKTYDRAIEYYRKAELFDCDRLWVSKKLGLCYMKSKDWSNARKQFEDAARLKPDDLLLHIQIGQCCLNLHEFEDALEHFGKVRYYQPDNMKVLRPVAYCHFILGKLDEATGFYNDILASDGPSPYDYMNAGHVHLCLGNRKGALDLYKKCFNDSTFLPELFIAAFEEDAPWLEKNGVSREEIPLILDYLLFQKK
jgi:tetratricopeptide (TPR) repeat protein